MSELEQIQASIAEEMADRHKEGKFSEDLWKRSVADLQAGFAEGTFDTRQEVSEALGTDVWFDTVRFAARQAKPAFRENEKGEEVFELLWKTRACDDEKANRVNDAATVFEKMNKSDRKLS